MTISHTAAYVAVKFYGLTLDRKIGQHFKQPVLDFYKNMVGFLPKHLSWYQNSLHSPFWRKLFIWSEELLLPGDLMHIFVRKYVVQKQIEEAIQQGFEQFVILGAGFDHLGVTLSRQGFTAIELDLKHMAKHKLAFVEQFGYVNDQLIIKKYDADSDSLEQTLRSVTTFNPAQKTVFIAEGFFDYLSLIPSEELLSDIRKLNKQNRLISTFFSLDELNLFHRFIFTSGVSLVGESLKFKLEKDEFVEFLNEMGFRVTKETGKQDMIETLLRPSAISLPVLNGFYVLDASVKI